jgi:hypothetical protein
MDSGYGGVRDGTFTGMASPNVRVAETRATPKPQQNKKAASYAAWWNFCELTVSNYCFGLVAGAEGLLVLAAGFAGASFGGAGTPD